MRDLYIYFRVLKRFISFRKIRKILIKLLFIIAFIIIFLLLLKNNSFCAISSDTTFATMPSSLISAIENTSLFKTGNYEYVIGRNDGSYYKVVFIQKTDGLKLYLTNATASGTYIKWKGNKAINIQEWKSNATGSDLAHWKTTNSSTGEIYMYQYKTTNCEFFSTLDVYMNSSLTTKFFTAEVPSVEPSILNTQANLTRFIK